MSKKKTAVIKEKNPSSLMGDIQKLHACIEGDQKQLAKLYQKMAGDAKKSLLTLKKSLLKVKKQVTKTKDSKHKAPENHQQALTALKQSKAQLLQLKSDETCATQGLKKHIAQQKLIKTFEKDWQRKTAPKKLVKTNSKAVKNNNHVETSEAVN